MYSKRATRYLAAVAGVLSCVACTFGAASGPCDPRDSSATFSSGLSLPQAEALPWSEIRAQIAAGNFAEAERLLEAVQPSAERQFWSGVLRLHERKTFASIRSFERAARLNDTSQTETLLAVDYFLLNQKTLAADALQRALRLNPHDLMALYLQGRLDFVGDSWVEAREDFAAVLAREPNDDHSLYYLGLSEWRMGDNAAARRDLQHAVDVLNCHHLNFPLAPYSLAQIELDSGDAAEALHQSDLALEMAESVAAGFKNSGDLAKLLLLRGKIEERLGRPKEAEQDFQHSLKLDPYLAEVWYLLARVYRSEGKNTQAARALKEFQQIQSQL